jgi:hypothetical protein
MHTAAGLEVGGGFCLPTDRNSNLFKLMDIDRLNRAAGAYEAAFGEDAIDVVFVPPYVGDPAFASLLEEAVTRGTALTDEEVTRKLGPAFRESVRE